MVKFGKNKFKALNKLTKRQSETVALNNKILKKKINAEKKVSFQKEVLLKEAASENKSLVKKLSFKDLLTNELSKTDKNKKPKEENVTKKKLKPVEKQKKRQKTQINDTKLLLSLMKKK